MKDVTFGVCDLTLPARARDPWTFPMASKGGFGVCSEGRGRWVRTESRYDAEDVLMTYLRLDSFSQQQWWRNAMIQK